jgi:YegS/Rv2252/BmrU family lipid kinase
MPNESWERKEALIIFNPTAHNAPSRRRLEEIILWMQSEGWRVSWEETHKRGDGIGLAARAAEGGIPLVLACGGDGTVNEVVNGLDGSESSLGMIPAGTSNLWAREVGLDKSPAEAVRLMVHGERRLIDLGRTGERYFVLLAGFGIDAAITRHVPLGIKDRIGAAAYGLSAVRELLRWKSVRTTVRMDGVEREVDLLMALAGNTRLYAGLTQVTPTAKVDDGKLDVCIYQGSGRRDIIFHSMRTLTRIHRKARNVIYRRVRKVEFIWEEPVPVQVDGDTLDYCPTEAVICPRSLWVAVPTGLRSPIFLPRPANQRRSQQILARQGTG